MSPPAIDWDLLSERLEPDGSLRDIYVRDAHEQVWAAFLAALSGSAFRYLVTHGDRPLDRLFTTFEAAAALRKTDSVLLQIDLSPTLTANCHFFSAEEIELDIDPRHLPDAAAVSKVVEFMEWLARAVNRPVLLTSENQPQHVIVRVDAAGTFRWK